jgi:uncharacterized membrane protein
MMPNIGHFHPQIVHFVVALLLLGVALRIASLIPKLKFANHAAALLLLIGTGAAVLAVQSGTDAHGPVERIPGARAAVVEHEELAKQAKNIFLAVAALELIALGLARPSLGVDRYARVAQVGSVIVGLYGSFVLYEASEHGGELVYSYAGGPGLRTGRPADVERLLLAGLYNQSREDRKAGHAMDAATLVDEMARRFPQNSEVRLLRVESLMLDRKDYTAARIAADSVSLPASDARLRARQATLKADAYLGMSQPDSARAVLAAALAAFPQNVRLKAKLDSIK